MKKTLSIFILLLSSVAIDANATMHGSDWRDLIFRILGGNRDTTQTELELHKVCLAYQRQDYSWSKYYKMNAVYTDGNALNHFASKYGHYANYSNYAQYAVIFFKEGGYIALEINPMYLSSYTASNTKDQTGRIWKIKKDWEYCY